MPDYSDAALILVGHGSTVNRDSEKPTFQHAAELRKTSGFGKVVEAFLKQPPYVQEVVKTMDASRLFVVPLFICDGYFTEEVIPKKLGLLSDDKAGFSRIRKTGDQTLFYCRPVGTDPGMTQVLLARAEAVVHSNPQFAHPSPKETSLFVAGHGTPRNPNSRKTIENQAALIRGLNIYAEVLPAFMEEDPYIANCYSVASQKNIVMVPFFMSDGLHSVEDIPVLLGDSADDVKKRFEEGKPTWINPTERSGKRLWYSSSIGSDPLVPKVIMNRVKELET